MACTATLALGAAVASPARAQETSASQATEVDEIVVTGQRAAPRSRLETPAPVDVIDGETLDAAATVGGELGYALQTLAPSFNLPRQSNSGPADVVRAAQLRGLAPDQTLVLLNGKRRHTTPIVNLESKIGRGSTPTDFNAIPSSAIGRAEILRDGAGAQYGSDAIAGVVNLRLDDRREGGEATVSYGAHVTDFEPTGQDLTDGETVVATAHYGWRLGEDGFLRVGGEWKTREATARGGPDQIPFFENQTPANLAFQGRVNYRPGDPEIDQGALWFNTAVAAGGGELYAFGTYDTREGRGAAFFRYPDSSQTIPSVYPNGYRPQTTVDSRDFQIVGGWRGTLGAWGLDAALNLGGGDYEFGVENSLNASLGAASPRSFKLGTYENSLTSLTLDLTRDFDVAGLASPLSLATGVEARRETFETGAGDPDSYAAGPLTDRPIGAQAGPGLRPQDTADADRDVHALYAELSADLTDRLFVDAAARYEDYSDFGDALAGKLSARFEASDAVALRASASNSFRAPSLSQTAFQFSVTSLGSGGALTTIRTVSPTSAIGRSLGARPLEAETSTNLSAGVVFDFRPDVTVTLDAYRIDVDDRITLSERFGGSALEAYVLAQTGTAGVTDVNFFTNGVDTRTEGVDLVATWRTAVFDGRLNLTGAASWSETEIRSLQATPAQLVALGAGPTLVGVEERNTVSGASPDHRIVVSADWERGPVGLFARVTRDGETTRVFNFGGGFEPTQTYGATTRLDLRVDWRVTERLELSAGGDNVLDQYPDRSIADISYFGNLPYDVLSPIGFNGAF